MCQHDHGNTCLKVPLVLHACCTELQGTDTAANLATRPHTGALACMQAEKEAMETAMAQAGAAVERAQVWAADARDAC